MSTELEAAIKQAERVVNAREAELGAARERVLACQRDLKNARAAVGEAVKGWMAVNRPVTFESLARGEIAAGRQYAADVKAGGVAPGEQPRKANSVIDKINGLGSDINRGYSRAYARGAFPMSMRGRRVAMPTKV